MLKTYYLKIEAIKITKKNFQKLVELDTADGVLHNLDSDSAEDFVGDWFATGANGYQVISGSETLIPEASLKT